MVGPSGAESLLASLFRRLGRGAARCPALFIAAPLVVFLAFLVGFKDLVIDSDPDTIWVPPGSDTSLQQHFSDDAFDPFYRINQLILLLDESGGGARATGGSFYSNTTAGDVPTVGILTREYMLAALELQAAIVATPASDGSTLDRLCFKPIQGSGCLIETPLDYFLSDAAALGAASVADIQAAIDNRLVPVVSARHAGYLPGWSSIHTPMMPSVILGGAGCLRGNVSGFKPSVCGGCGVYANALVITFLLQATSALAPAAAAWESEVFLAAAANFSYPGLRISYMAQRSVSDEIARLGAQNQLVVVISYACMFAYISLALGKFPHPVFMRVLLGAQGILIVILSASAAIGICAAAGMHITMIVTEVVPFLILALGAAAAASGDWAAIRWRAFGGGAVRAGRAAFFRG